MTVHKKIQEAEPQIKTVRAEGEWKGSYRTDLDVRDFHFVIAEPEKIGGKGFFVEDPRDIRGALDEAMNFRGPALVNVVISQGSARKPQQFRWHS